MSIILIETNRRWVKGNTVLPWPTNRRVQSEHSSEQQLLNLPSQGTVFMYYFTLSLCPIDLAGQGFDIYILAWDLNFLLKFKIYMVYFKDFFT